MRTELSLANTFLDVSETSSVQTHQEKSRLDAVAAYHSLLHYLPKLQLTPEEATHFATGLEALRARMLSAGMAV